MKATSIAVASLAGIAMTVFNGPTAALQSKQPAADADIAIQPPVEAPSDSIYVEFGGPLSVGYFSKLEADSPRELSMAQITTAGATIHLDWSRSDKIRDELLSVPIAGDSRIPYAEVTGRMKFKPLRETDQKVVIPQRGVAAGTPVPVVIVESIQVYLAGPDGKRRGPQPVRKRVVAEERPTADDDERERQ